MEVHDSGEIQVSPVSDVCDPVLSEGEAPSLTTRQTVLASLTSGVAKWFVVAALFALCIAPTFISYQPYLFQWDDSEYLGRSIAASRAFWSGNGHGLIGAMVSIRPPMMTLLGLPWGPLRSWDAAGDCFITLAALIALLVASSLYLLLRSGVKPLFLVVAGACVGASMGPFPAGSYVHTSATGFLADSLFAWTALAAVLLIPYEARTLGSSIRGAVMRGVLWGAILSLGVMTKLSFLYFVILIVPLLFAIKLHYGGLRSALAGLLGFACCSAPSAFYLLQWGQPAFALAKGTSFGSVAQFYYSPLLQFLGNIVRESPGVVLPFVLTAAGLIYLGIKGRLMQSWPCVLALVVMAGFCVVVLAAPARDVRYAFPVIVALPFLAATVMSGKGHSTPRRSAALVAALVFCGLLVASVPTRHRASRQSLSRSEAVLALASRNNATSIMLATDSPTLNGKLMVVAREFSPSRVSACGSLAYQAMSGVPIEADFQLLSRFDAVVFQDGRALSPPFTNQRVPEYEQYVRRVGYGPIRVGDDTSVYLMH